VKDQQAVDALEVSLPLSPEDLAADAAGAPQQDGGDRGPESS
jgi:hypothetical protein